MASSDGGLDAVLERLAALEAAQEETEARFNAELEKLRAENAQLRSQVEQRESNVPSFARPMLSTKEIFRYHLPFRSTPRWRTWSHSTVVCQLQFLKSIRAAMPMYSFISNPTRRGQFELAERRATLTQRLRYVNKLRYPRPRGSMSKARPRLCLLLRVVRPVEPTHIVVE